MDYFCFYALQITLEVNARLADFGIFVPVFRNSYFQFFRVIFKILYTNLKKYRNLTHLAIVDKVFPYTLNVEW